MTNHKTIRKIFLISTVVIFISIFIFTGCAIQEKPPYLTDTFIEDVVENQEENQTDDAQVSSGHGDENTGQAGIVNSNDFDLGMLNQMENEFMLVDALPGMTFANPLEIVTAEDGTNRLFIVEQGGKIFAIDEDRSGKELFLDISQRVSDNASEKGLLGLAFHPDFESTGQFYVNYTNASSTVISMFKINEGDPDSADSGSETVILSFEQPFGNHNGGKLAFGPADGYLYISTGDGGGAGDPNGNGQSLNTFLGKILRIDIDNDSGGDNYSIPADNPFAGNNQGYFEEIYAYGLRNPWRFSFDTSTGRLWAADVGQNRIEEIDIIERGQNYGWNIMEGSSCHEPPSGCDQEGLVPPVYEYRHPLGQSITGGYVYRGERLPVLEGLYIYADFVSGYVWGLAYAEGEETRNFVLADTGLNISSFGVDESGELYIAAFDGKIYHLDEK